MSSTVLSLLVALVSVLTVAVPVLKNAFTPANSSIKVIFQGADSKTLSLFVTNQGTRPGAVRNPVGTLYVGLNMVALTVKPLNSFVPPTVIEPDKSVLLNLFGTRLGGPENVREYKFNKCWIEFDTLDFRGVEYIDRVPVPCDKVEEFMAESPRIEVGGGE